MSRPRGWSSISSKVENFQFSRLSRPALGSTASDPMSTAGSFPGVKW
jgi:hypothetical protein